MVIMMMIDEEKDDKKTDGTLDNNSYDYNVKFS